MMTTKEALTAIEALTKDSKSTCERLLLANIAELVRSTLYSEDLNALLELGKRDRWCKVKLVLENQETTTLDAEDVEEQDGKYYTKYGHYRVFAWRYGETRESVPEYHDD